jgi:RTX calcium-binding nonapeptide repeat (4 copies)
MRKTALVVAVMSLLVGWASTATFAAWFSQPEPQQHLVCIESGSIVPCPPAEKMMEKPALLVKATTTMYGTSGNDYIFATIQCPSYGLCYGTSGNDYIYGTDGWNHIIAYGGDDHIYAGGSGDQIEGRNGNDVAYGFGGKDRFYMSGDCSQDTSHGGKGWDKGWFESGDKWDSVEQVSVSLCARR